MPELLEPVRLLLELLARPSTTGSEGPLGQFVLELMGKTFRPDVLECQEVGPGRFNVFMAKGEPRITFTSHLDTVPGEVRVRRAEGRVYGRGACDAKGQIVAQLCALQRAEQQGLRNFGAFYVVGEEVDSAGAMAAARHPALGAAYLLNGEPTGNRFARRSAGVIDTVIRSRGSQVHSSLAKGNSALHRLLGDLAALLCQDSPDFLVNVGTIEAPGVSNVTCGSALARVCVRPAGSVNDALAQLRGCLADCELELVGPAVTPFEFHVPQRFEQNAIAVPFCSDAPLYASRAEQVLMCGPGAIAEAHTPDEFIEEHQLYQGVDLLAGLALSL